jgi:hypothetical protein
MAERRVVARVGWIHPRLNPTEAHGVCEGRQETSRWEVENQLTAPFPE